MRDFLTQYPLRFLKPLLADGVLRKFCMAAIAKRRLLGGFTSTKKDRFGRIGCPRQALETAPLMGSITKRLFCTQPTGAPIVSFAVFNVC